MAPSNIRWGSGPNTTGTISIWSFNSISTRADGQLCLSPVGQVKPQEAHSFNSHLIKDKLRNQSIGGAGVNQAANGPGKSSPTVPNYEISVKGAHLSPYGTSRENQISTSCSRSRNGHIPYLTWTAALIQQGGSRHRLIAIPGTNKWYMSRRKSRPLRKSFSNRPSLWAVWRPGRGPRWPRSSGRSP